MKSGSASRRRYRLDIRGAVQGVGFRPFVYRLAGELKLTGWVTNTNHGVTVELEGPRAALEAFVNRLKPEQPPRAAIAGMEIVDLDPTGIEGFTIRPSVETGTPATVILPDIATCAECLAEIRDLSARRYRYPFTNCTNCGPRYSILEQLPYDRQHTTMRDFAMCAECRTEYEEPLDRRFHAQPIACPACGPHMQLHCADGSLVAGQDRALVAAAEMLSKGLILAVKGLGGFHLMVDAGSSTAVRTLRKRKQRAEKPFAVMVADLSAARKLCRIGPREERVLESPEAPIVLLERLAESGPATVVPEVAPENPYLGIMLPSNPIHHLLLGEFGGPLVATSGNISEEPICIETGQAQMSLAAVADGFLVHDRPIARPLDDSVVRVVLDRELVMRRARGYAPMSFALAAPVDVLAVGGEMKSAVTVVHQGLAYLGQHLGDLENADTYDVFRRELSSLIAMVGARPAKLACDLHPEYRATDFARQWEPGAQCVQHHHAHVVACMVENELDGPVLGVAWDGTGYGPDGTIWGGEFLRATRGEYVRIGHLRHFRLPGGTQAIREPRRAAMGVLFELNGSAVTGLTGLPLLSSFSRAQLRVVVQLMERGFQAPVTSSAGRLFDAVASMLNLRHIANFEGQPAMLVEHAALGVAEAAPYSYQWRKPEAAGPAVLDWSATIRELLRDGERGVGVSEMAARFHETLAVAIAEFAESSGETRVVLTGGCFQNRRLLERAVHHLRRNGRQVYWHQRVPPGDGGISLGQAAVAAATLLGAGR